MCIVQLSRFLDPSDSVAGVGELELTDEENEENILSMRQSLFNLFYCNVIDGGYKGLEGVAAPQISNLLM